MILTIKIWIKIIIVIATHFTIFSLLELKNSLGIYEAFLHQQVGSILDEYQSRAVKQSVLLLSGSIVHAFSEGDRYGLQTCRSGNRMHLFECKVTSLNAIILLKRIRFLHTSQ